VHLERRRRKFILFTCGFFVSAFTERRVENALVDLDPTLPRPAKAAIIMFNRINSPSAMQPVPAAFRTSQSCTSLSNNLTSSPGLNAGSPIYGHPSHLNASPSAQFPQLPTFPFTVKSISSKSSASSLADEEPVAAGPAFASATFLVL